MSKQYRCEWCGKVIDISAPNSHGNHLWFHIKRFEYVPSVSYGGDFHYVEEDFCSEECMIKWIYRGLNRKNDLRELISTLQKWVGV